MPDNVNLSGPLFDGRAAAALDEYGRRAPEDIAVKGEQMVREHLDKVLRQNHHVYTERVHVRSEGHTQVIENDMVYSPWLEGTSERNRSTHFKGYHTFRIIGQQLDDRAGELGDELLQPYLHEMQ